MTERTRERLPELLLAEAGRRTSSCASGPARRDDLYPVQRAFLEHDGYPCGYRAPGRIKSAVALLVEERSLDRDGIRDLPITVGDRAGEEGVLASVVETVGSTFRQAGARMLVGPNGWLAGAVSGGRLERHVLARAFLETRRGPILTTYDTSADDARADGASSTSLPAPEVREALSSLLATRRSVRAAVDARRENACSPREKRSSVDVSDAPYETSQGAES